MGKVYQPDEFPVPTEVYSRVVGYIRPINQWNEGKQEEFAERKVFDTALEKKPTVQEVMVRTMSSPVHRQ